MNQQLTALRILHRHERAVVAEIEKQIGPNMEPGIKKLFEQKKANSEHLREKIESLNSSAFIQVAAAAEQTQVVLR